MAEIVTRDDLEGGEPTAQSGPERAGQPGAIAEIDDMQRAAGRDNVERPGERVAPRRDHRQGVGDHDAVELSMAEQSLGIERRRVPLPERDAGGEPGACYRSRRARQHLARHIEAEQPRRRDRPAPV